MRSSGCVCVCVCARLRAQLAYLLPAMCSSQMFIIILLYNNEILVTLGLSHIKALPSRKT